MNYLLAFLLLGLVVLVHELGHFIAAKVVGLPIRIFSIGFGPKLIAIKWCGTEYRLSIVPLGGYVMPEIEDEAGFFNLPIRERLIMSLGGPIASLILPLGCLALINTITLGFSFSDTFIKPFIQLGQMLTQMLALLPTVFSHPKQLSGVIGIVAEGSGVIAGSWLNGLYFITLISINLAVLNLIPFPVFDGGKVLLYLLEKIHPKLLKLHIPLSIAGWVILFGLMVYVTWMDIGKYFG